MTRDQLNVYRRRLVRLSAALDQRLAHDRRELMRADGPDRFAGPAAADADGTDSGADAVGIGLIAHEEHLLAELVDALDRIDDGTFGECEACGRRIARARLDALPYARQCIRCAHAARPTPG